MKLQLLEERPPARVWHQGDYWYFTGRTALGNKPDDIGMNFGLLLAEYARSGAGQVVWYDGETTYINEKDVEFD